MLATRYSSTNSAQEYQLLSEHFHLLVLRHYNESIMTGQALLDSLLSLAITIIVTIVDIKGTILTSIGIREDLMHSQQQLLILRVVHLQLLPLQLLPLARHQDQCHLICS